MGMLPGRERADVVTNGAARVIAPDASEPVIDTSRGGTDICERKPAGLILEIANVVYDATLWWRWFSGLLVRLRPQLQVAALKESWEMEYLPSVRRGRREFGETLERFLHASGLARGEIDEVLAAGLTRRRDLEFEVHPFPGVKQMLRRLCDADVRLAVLSDSASTTEEVCQRIERLGLGGLFSVVISSVELEHVKPALICYETALRRLHLARNDVWFLGQTISDLAGARRAGLQTIGFRSDAQAPASKRIARFNAMAELALSHG